MFETTGSLGSDFKCVYDLHMCIEALSKALILYDMTNVFQILPGPTVLDLELKLRAVHASQTEESRIELELIGDPTNQTLVTELGSAQAALALSSQHLQGPSITTMILIKYFKDTDESTIRQSNSYYVRYGSSWLVNNLS